MWEIYEHKSVAKQLKRVPKGILLRYEKWKDIVRISGPAGLRMIKGFRDESLEGQWKGFRSSRLNLQYRVIYMVDGENVLVKVEEVTPHDYRKK